MSNQVQRQFVSVDILNNDSPIIRCGIVLQLAITSLTVMKKGAAGGVFRGYCGNVVFI